MVNSADTAAERIIREAEFIELTQRDRVVFVKALLHAPAQASEDANKGVALPFMLISADGRIAGYYTLGSYGTRSDDIPARAGETASPASLQRLWRTVSVNAMRLHEKIWEAAADVECGATYYGTAGGAMITSSRNTQAN